MHERYDQSGAEPITSRRRKRRRKGLVSIIIYSGPIAPPMCTGMVSKIWQVTEGDFALAKCGLNVDAALGIVKILASNLLSQIADRPQPSRIYQIHLCCQLSICDSSLGTLLISAAGPTTLIFMAFGFVICSSEVALRDRTF